MKYLLILFLLSVSVEAKEVILKINHYANGEKLELGDKVFNVNGTEIKLKRLEYYLSNFKLIDDNNNEFSVVNNYQFINVKFDEYILGNVEVENISKFIFHFGIDSVTNHSDPSQYPEFSPLYIIGKDNHWGWAAGYKFVMLEGFAKNINGSFLNNFNFHLFGNVYFARLELEPEVQTTDDKIYINLDFNLEDLVNNVSLTQNNQHHGEGGQNDIIGSNISSGIVFKSEVASVGDELPEINISPNPTSDIINISYGNTNLSGLEVTISNILGANIQNYNPYTTSKIDVSNYTKGIYFLNISKNGEILKTIKFIKN